MAFFALRSAECPLQIECASEGKAFNMPFRPIEFVSEIFVILIKQWRKHALNVTLVGQDLIKIWPIIQNSDSKAIGFEN